MEVIERNGLSKIVAALAEFGGPEYKRYVVDIASSASDFIAACSDREVSL
jgi:hypothetical protein